MVHTVVSTEISAPPDQVAALYADYEGWPRLFPATIHGVRLLADGGERKIIEVDHATEGKVINIMTLVSPDEIRLEEFKRRFDARFLNRFEAAGRGTRYSIVAEVQLKGAARVLATLASPIVRARLSPSIFNRTRGNSQIPRRCLPPPKKKRTFPTSTGVRRARGSIYCRGCSASRTRRIRCPSFRCRW